MNHQQLFNEKSQHYANIRPQYPQEIYEYLASICQEQNFVWDGACGNGQASVGLGRYFAHVEATDISEQQIAHAIQNPKVTYTVQAAEKTNFSDNQFDLVTVAQALHWFDLNLFWTEVKRVLKPAGIFATWGYSWFSVDDQVDATIKEIFLKILDPYWAPQNKLLWDHYRQIPLPFKQLPVPKIEMKMRWDLNQLFTYLQSWSATRLCIEEIGTDFLSVAYESVKLVWGEESKTKDVIMDFFMLVGQYQP